MTESKFQKDDDPLTGKVCPVDDVPIRGASNRKFCSNRCRDKAGRLRNAYGLTVEQYRQLVEDTGGRCPLCRNLATMWQVDHNHKTREVTGVVCIACNVGALAYTFHDVEFVDRLRAYLTESPAARLGIHSLVPEKYNKPSNLHKTWGYKRKY